MMEIGRSLVVVVIAFEKNILEEEGPACVDVAFGMF
jgi:hypothetical protein